MIYPSLKSVIIKKQTRLRLATTACNYGGYRKWFVCKCGRRASVFYFSRYWQCRHCVGLQLSYWDWINQKPHDPNQNSVDLMADLMKALSQ